MLENSTMHNMNEKLMVFHAKGTAWTFALYGGQSDGGAFRAGRMTSLQMGRICLFVSRF